MKRINKLITGLNVEEEVKETASKCFANLRKDVTVDVWFYN
jgi:hypothetical protein